MESQTKITKKIKMGMVGGGPDSFIGPIHRIAAQIDSLIDIVSGCFSSSYEKSLKVGQDLGIAESRIYKSYEEMFEKESQLNSEDRMDFVAIATPNHLHFPQTKLALKSGFHVVLDKPLCFTVNEGLELESIINESKLLFCLTHTYTGYPLIKEARHIIKSNKLGKVRKVQVEYPQAWLSTKLEDSGHKQAEWRTDPKRSGAAGCLGDIGTHAFNLAEYITGLKVSEICAEISTFIEGRVLDDDASVLLRFENGAKGVLLASQISAGEENSLRIQVWGETGGIEWIQSDCNSLKLKWLEKPTEIYRAGTNYSYLSETAKKNCRTPGGHPEGYLEAFANIYRNFALTIKDQQTDKEVYDFPGIEDGIRGMLFIEKCLESSKSQQKWTKLI
jgi:predicted dehydrogenase